MSGVRLLKLFAAFNGSSIVSLDHRLAYCLNPIIPEFTSTTSMDLVTVIKFVTALLYPLGLVFTAVLVGMLAWFLQRPHWAKRVWAAAVLLLWVASTPQTAIWLTSILERQNPPRDIAALPEHDFIVVMGGGLRLPAPPVNRVQFTGSTDRYWLATQLLAANKAPRAILLGGNVYPQPGLRAESEYARELMVTWGASESHIEVDSHSRTTEQNVSQLRLVMQSLHSMADQPDAEPASVLVVTSALHMPRTLFWLRHEFGQELVFTAASADILIRDEAVPSFKHWLPDAGAIYLLTLAIHEVYGLWYARLKVLLGS